MSNLQTLVPKNTLENRLLFLLFGVFFLFFIVQTPIYSPDTFSYLRADITRYPGYIVYLRGLRFIIGSSFDLIALAGHLVMGCAAVGVVFKNVSKLFHLSWIAKGVLLAVLLFPYFKPIEVAVNLTSEGLAYPLYLLLLSFTIDFLFRNQSKKIIPIAFIYIALVLTRGQFVIVAPIIGFLVAIKRKDRLFKPRTLGMILFLCFLPLLASVADKTYRYIFYGYFEATPYSYVNVITLPLFISDADDAHLFDDLHHKKLYQHSYKTLDSLQLLSSKVKGSDTDKYMRFHYNFPKICNQNIHDYGLKYYLAQGMPPNTNAFAIEEACKAMTPKLIRAHFNDFIRLYYTSIVHGFKSVYILFFVVLVSIFSFVKLVKRYRQNRAFILLATLLILSNAMIVAVASHSIMRYLFYNYFLGLLILIILLKKLIPRHES